MEIGWKDEILYKDLVKWGARLEKETPFFKELLKDKESENTIVLDVSCGTGLHLVMLCKWGFSGIGVDISEQNIEEANRIAEESNVQSKINFILGDIVEINEVVKEQSFDFIYFIGNTLSIFDRHERNLIIQKLIQILNPGGKILIQSVNYLAHAKDDVWFYNPNLKRSSKGGLTFHIRMMEWKEREQKVTMYVQSILQESKDSDNFELFKKRTEFFVPKIEDFETLQTQKNIEVSFYGDYYWSKFKKEKSNDLVVIIEKNT